MNAGGVAAEVLVLTHWVELYGTHPVPVHVAHDNKGVLVGVGVWVVVLVGVWVWVAVLVGVWVGVWVDVWVGVGVGVWVGIVTQLTTDWICA